MTKPSTNDLITSALALLAGDDEDRTTALAAWLDAADAKLTALYYLRRAALSRADVYQAEADRWADLARRERVTCDWAEGRAKDLLHVEREVSGFSPEDPYQVTLGNGCKLGFRLNPPAVMITDKEAIPADLWRHPTPPPPEPDKRAILERLKAQQAVPGAALVRGQRFDWGDRGKAHESIHPAITGGD